MFYAYMLALPIRWDRERSERTAGLRRLEIALLVSVLTFFTLRVMTSAKGMIETDDSA